MEQRDLELIEKYSRVDDRLKKYVEEHRKYEQTLEGLISRVLLTPEEEIEQKRLKKLKLMGRDKIELILKKYRMRESSPHRKTNL